MSEGMKKVGIFKPEFSSEKVEKNKKKMKENSKLMMIFMIVFVVLGVSSSSCAAAGSNNEELWWRRKWGPSPSSSSSSSRSSRSQSTINKLMGSSSIKFQLYGNVYPDGHYYVQVVLGNPPSPYFLDPDTGSDLTWLQCDAPCVRCTKVFHRLYKPSKDLVLCRDPLCASLHPSNYPCDNPQQCDYDVKYADGGSSLGVLVNDSFTLNLASGDRMSPRLILGCGYNQVPGAYDDHPSDGVFGLGKGKSSIVSQLHEKGVVKNVVGHCLSKQGGFLFLGENVYDSSHITWTSMARDHTKHYAAGLAELRFDGKSTGFKNLNIIFDSGSSYTYFNSPIYHSLLTFINKELDKKPLRETNDDTLPFCWTGNEPFKSTRDVRKYFKPLAFSFPNGWRTKPQFEITPEAYLIISSKGNACLGILNGTEVGLNNFNIIGDISMQDKLLIYDNEKEEIGWTPANCDPKSSTK